jgi:hypothetical protein
MREHADDDDDKKKDYRVFTLYLVLSLYYLKFESM